MARPCRLMVWTWTDSDQCPFFFGLYSFLSLSSIPLVGIGGDWPIRWAVGGRGGLDHFLISWFVALLLSFLLLSTTIYHYAFFLPFRPSLVSILLAYTYPHHPFACGKYPPDWTGGSGHFLGSVQLEVTYVSSLRRVKDREGYRRIGCVHGEAYD